MTLIDQIKGMRVMQTLTFSEYQKQTDSTAIYRRDQALEYLTLGLASEAGEVAGLHKKLLRDGDKNGDYHEKMAAEIGDTLWYLSQIANELGLSLSMIAGNNLAKLADRQSRGVIRGSGDTR